MTLLKNSWTMFKITSTMQTNSFISLLRKIPLVERLIPVSLYRREGVKRLFTLGGLLKGLFGGFVGGTLLCMFVMNWLPAWISVEVSREEMLLLFILVQCFAPVLQSCNIFRAKEEDYVFLNHFMMNPTEYYHYKIGKKVLEDLVTILPVLLYLLRDVRLVLVALASNLFFSLAGCCLHLFLYDRLHNMVKRSVRNIVSGGIMLAAYFCLKQGVFAGITVSFPLCAGLCFGLLTGAFLCYYRLLQYKDYKRIAVQFANKEAMIVIAVNIGAEEGRDALSKFLWEKNKAFYEKHKKEDAATYLNRAFFERFKGVFSNQRKQIFLFSILLGVLLGYLIRNGVLDVTEETILTYTPLLIVLVNSIMLFGQRFTTLCFRFVDMPLMYHQVCDKEYLKKSIRCRYAFLVRHSLVALVGLIVFVALLLVVSGIRISVWDFIFMLVAMELFMLIQEFYQLLIYYWIQPYTADVSVKSPVFKVLGCLEGLFDVSMLFVRGNLAMACVPLLGLFLLVNVLLAVISERVQKTFRLRY